MPSLSVQEKNDDNNESALLHQLRAAPQIFTEISQLTGSDLQRQKQLRKTYADNLVRAALTLSELRQRAAKKFSQADKMWFDRKGLEQSTTEHVANYKAKRFSGTISDYCCGIGSDAIALSHKGDLLAVDLQPAACLRTEWNAKIYQTSLETITADVTAFKHRGGLVHIDPDRRPHSSGKTVRVEDALPGLDFLQTLPRFFSGGAIKLSPAGNFAGKFLGVEHELISLSGECKEATIWFGDLAGKHEWRATALSVSENNKIIEETISGDPLEAYVEVGAIKKYLYDPDPALVRSALVNQFAEENHLSRLDDAEEYLTGETLLQSQFVAPFEVLAELPNNEKEIRRWFRQSEIGQVEIKCRHIPVKIEAIRKKLPLKGNQPGVLIFARIAGRARALICRRIQRSQIASY